MKKNVWSNNNWIKDANYYIDRVFGKLKIVLSLEDQEDIRQNALLRVWAQRLKYDTKRPFRGWLVTVIRNNIINQLRDQFGAFTKEFSKPNIRHKINHGSWSKDCPIEKRNSENEEIYQTYWELPAPSSFDLNARLIELSNHLNYSEKLVLDCCLDYPEVGQRTNYLKSKKIKISTFYSIRNSIRTKYNKLFNSR